MLELIIKKIKQINDVSGETKKYLHIRRRLVFKINKIKTQNYIQKVFKEEQFLFKHSTCSYAKRKSC